MWKLTKISSIFLTSKAQVFTVNLKDTLGSLQGGATGISKYVHAGNVLFSRFSPRN